MRTRFSFAMLTLLLVVMVGASALAADKAGCKDPDWAPKRLPNFFIHDCDTKAWTTLDVSLTSGSKTLEGSSVQVNYSLPEGASNSPTAAVVWKNYVQQAQSAGAKLVSDPRSGYNAVMKRDTPQGTVWYLYDHGSGNENETYSYTLTTFTVGGMAQQVQAQPLTAPLDTHAKNCTDPPWLVKQFDYFKLNDCNNRDYDTIKIDLPDGKKTLVGHVLEHRYKLTDQSKNPVALLVEKNYVTALQKIGAKLVSNPHDVFEAVLTQHDDKLGDLWYIYEHGSGSQDSTGSYKLTTIEVGGAPPKDCTVEVYGVNFDFNKATLRPDSEPVLNQVLALFKADPQMKAEIGGHTDNVGNAAYNLKLSADRADAVKNWLASHGVDAARLSSHGYGQTMPLVPNTSDENRAKNRRVELKKVGCKP